MLPKSVHTGVISVWTVFFMRKLLGILALTMVLGVFVYMSTVAMDKKQLSEDILRLHVVAASDSDADQAVKLQVRDAVLWEVDNLTAGAKTADEAKAILRENLVLLERTANKTLEEQGFEDRASVTMTREAFPIREYETFTLPSGVYESLRVTIGPGDGQNWWCVVFPGLCVPAASEEVEDAAQEAGLNDSLTGAITQEPEYEIRFFVLDLWGRIENFFYKK